MKALSLTTQTVLVAACLLGMVATLAHAAADDSEAVVSAESNHQEENSGKNLGAMNSGSWNSNDYNSGSNPAPFTPVPGVAYSPLYTVVLKSGATGAAAESEIRANFYSRFGLPGNQIVFVPQGGATADDDVTGGVSFKIAQAPGSQGAAASDAINSMDKAASGNTQEQQALGFSSVTASTPAPMTMVPPTPLPPGQTHAPTTMVPPTPVPTTTPLPPGQTYAPTTMVPPTPVPTTTPLPPGHTHAPTTMAPPTPLPPGQTAEPPTPAPMTTTAGSSGSASAEVKYSALFTVVLTSNATGEAGKDQIRTILENLGVRRDQIAFSTDPTTAGALSFVIEVDSNTADAIAKLTKASNGDKNEQAALGFSSASMAGANDDDNKKSTLSTGVLAVIVIGAIVIVVLVAGIIYKVSSGGGGNKGTGQTDIHTLDEELSPSRQQLLNTDATRGGV